MDNDICNVMRKPDSKTNRGQQVSGIAKENLKLAVFLFHHRWKCTYDLEVIGVKKDKVHLLAGEKRLKHKYKDLDVWSKVNKTLSL